MQIGVDTTFLVETDVAGHPGHAVARRWLEGALARGATLVLAPQVCAEYVHVVTDPRRFSEPLTPAAAMARAQAWWEARDVGHAFPDADTMSLFWQWMGEFRPGRKRLLDTLLAATYFSHGVRSVVSSNARDYVTFGCFDVIIPE